jgi:nitrilase
MDAGSGTFRAAAVQAEPVFCDADATIDKAGALIAEAAAGGAQLIAFPETWIPTYPWWIWLGPPVWGMRFVQRYYEHSLTVGDARFQRLQDAARANDIHVVAGYSERAGGSLYMGQAVIAADGALVAARRKLKPTHVERSLFGEGDGSDLAVHDLPIGRLGAFCCWEHLQPLSKYAMYSMGEEVHVASWPSFALYRGGAYALGPELNTAASQMYAAEGQCFVVAACATVSEATLGAVCDTPEQRQLLQAGGGFAMIFGPDGRPLAEPLAEDEEGLVVADIDLGLIPLSKSVADPAGHYARPDVTRLLLNDAPAPPVEDLRTRRRPVGAEVAEPQGASAREEHAASAGDGAPAAERPPVPSAAAAPA